MTMRQFREIQGVALEPMAGADVGKCIREALQMAVNLRCMVLFSFNGTPIKVDPDQMRNGYADQLWRDYFAARGDSYGSGSESAK